MLNDFPDENSKSVTVGTRYTDHYTRELTLQKRRGPKPKFSSYTSNQLRPTSAGLPTPATRGYFQYDSQTPVTTRTRIYPGGYLIKLKGPILQN